MGKDLEYTFRVKEGDLVGRIKGDLRKKYPELSDERMERYVKNAMVSIRALGNTSLFEGLILYGIKEAERGKNIDDFRKELDGEKEIRYSRI